MNQEVRSSSALPYCHHPTQVSPVAGKYHLAVQARNQLPGFWFHMGGTFLRKSHARGSRIVILGVANVFQERADYGRLGFVHENCCSRGLVNKALRIL